MELLCLCLLAFVSWEYLIIAIPFSLQKKTLRIIVGIRDRDSCREQFKKLKILPLKSQYILSIALFVINNKNYFQTNAEIHDINTRTKSNLHQA
jgi:hypothetical protein